MGKQKKFVQAMLEGKTREEAMGLAGIKDPELSAKRSAAGTAGAASRKRVEIQEQLRRKKGQAFEKGWTNEKGIYEAEVKDAISGEFVGWAYSILHGIAWSLLYPPPPSDFDYDNEISLEEQKYFMVYPDVALLDMIDEAKFYFKLSDPLRQLLIRVLTEYLSWEDRLSPDDRYGKLDPSDLPKFKAMLDKLNQGEDVFVGRPEEPKPKLKSVKEQIADRQKNYEKMAGSQQQVGPSKESLEQARIEQELQEQIRQQATEARRLIDQERITQDANLKATSFDAWKYLHGN